MTTRHIDNRLDEIEGQIDEIIRWFEWGISRLKALRSSVQSIREEVAG